MEDLKPQQELPPLTIRERPLAAGNDDGYAGSAYIREDGPYNRVAYDSAKRMNGLLERFKKDGLAEALFKTA